MDGQKAITNLPLVRTSVTQVSQNEVLAKESDPERLGGDD